MEHRINLWLGGYFHELPNRDVKYVGGRRFRSNPTSLDFFCERKLIDYYRMCGGRGMAVEFYYLQPGYDLANGLRPLDNEWAFIQMQEDCCDRSEVTVYAVKGPTPLCALDTDGTDVTMMAIAADQGQPILFLRDGAEPVFEEVVQEDEIEQQGEQMPEEGMTQEDGIPAQEDVHSADPSSSRPLGTQTTPEVEDPVIDFSFDFDSEDANGTETADLNNNAEQDGGANEDDTEAELEGQSEDEAQQNIVTEEQEKCGNEDDIRAHHDPTDEAVMEEGNEADTEADAQPDLDPCPEMEEEFRQQMEFQRKGKKRTEHTSGDPEESPDDSDDDSLYESETEPSDDESSEDQPSDCYSDIEGSQEDDIFVQRDCSKSAKKKKLAEMRKKKRLARKRRTEVNVEDVVPEQDEQASWYSDPEGDDNFDQPPASDNERPRVALFRDGDNIETLRFHIGLCFSGVDKYKEVLTDWSIRKGFELDFVKCERSRVTANCAGKGCKWRIHASVKQNSSLFEVKTLKGQHTCARGRTNFRAGATYIAARMEETIKDHPDVKISTLQNIVQRVVGVEITPSVAKRAKKLAMDKIRGENEAEFALLWDYCETVRTTNPGSTVFVNQIEDSSPPRFDRMYYSLAAMKQGFLDGCRPLIGLDGCFIKTVHGGQLLSAISKDGNDNLFPIAIAYVRSENSNTWKWFLEVLLADLGGQEGGRWTFISDRQKGLLDALNELAPECEHRYCLRHLYQNFSNRWKGQELKSLFWKAAAAANKEEWRDIMQQIKEVDPSQEEGQLTAYEWLIALHPDCWSRAFFRSSCKSDVLVNNICESWNNLILPARELAVIRMFEWIRHRILNRFGVKRMGMGMYEGVVCPNMLKKLNRNVTLANYCIPQWAGGSEFEVQAKDDQFIVKLDERTCTCGAFQLNGYPCCHACPCITYQREQLEDYIHDCYKKAAYTDAYKHVLHGVPGRKHYIKTGLEPLKGPEYKPKMGRPKKVRRKNASEAVTSSRTGLTHTCSRCYQLGHNVKTCTNTPHPNSRFYTVGLSSLDTATRRPTVPRSAVRRRTTEGHNATSTSSARTNVPSQRGRRRVFNRRQQLERAIRARAAARAVAQNSCAAHTQSTAPIAAQNSNTAAPPSTPVAAPNSASQVPSSRLPRQPSAAQTSPVATSAQTTTPGYAAPTPMPSGSAGMAAPIAQNASPSTQPQQRRAWNKRTTESEAVRNIRQRAQARRNQAPWKP